jgi:uncharacterized protein YicC (UPF0701 family)
MAKRVLDRFDMEAEREGKAFARHLVHQRISRGRVGKKIRKETNLLERTQHRIDVKFLRQYVVGSE